MYTIKKVSICLLLVIASCDLFSLTQCKQTIQKNLNKDGFEDFMAKSNSIMKTHTHHQHSTINSMHSGGPPPLIHYHAHVAPSQPV